jgi:hypothetical protein
MAYLFTAISRSLFYRENGSHELQPLSHLLASSSRFESILGRLEFHCATYLPNVLHSQSPWRKPKRVTTQQYQIHHRPHQTIIPYRRMPISLLIHRPIRSRVRRASIAGAGVVVGGVIAVFVVVAAILHHQPFVRAMFLLLFLLLSSSVCMGDRR